MVWNGWSVYPSNPKIADLEFPIADEHILGFDVAMHHLALMDVEEGHEQLGQPSIDHRLRKSTQFG